MNILHSFLLGVVEGLTEFLPISSTGHLIIAARLMGLAQTEFMKSFEIAIQLGAILAVVVLYWKMLFKDWEVMKRVAVAFLPTAAAGFVFYKLIKKYLFAGPELVIWTLFLGGVALIVFERFHKEDESAIDNIRSIPYPKLVAIGLFQCVAMIPGVSRAACTIVGGLCMGLRRRTIVEFSFLLAVPTMLAATVLDLLKSAHAFSGLQFQLMAVGFVTSFLVAVVVIRFLLRFIQTHKFTVFGIYRIVAAGVFWMLK